MLMFVGGASGSTAGGVRLSRIAVGYRGIVWWFRRTFVRARVLVPFQYEGQTIPEKVAEPELAKNMLVIILSVITIFIATLAILNNAIAALIGSGVDGSGVDGSGVDGSGVDGSGVDGSGVGGARVHGNGRVKIAANEFVRMGRAVAAAPQYCRYCDEDQPQQTTRH